MERGQADLFDGLRRPQIDAAFQTLLERLTSRLGPEAVVRAVPLPDAQPERTLRYEPAVMAGSQDGSSSASRPARAPKIKERSAGKRHSQSQTEERLVPEEGCVWRPLRMLETPLRVQVIAVAPDGPPRQVVWNGHSHRVTQSWGPERIETGWWRGDPIHRDYYRVELAGGLWLWIFRTPSETGWFVHGMFD
jgi:protein ImuB